MASISNTNLDVIKDGEFLKKLYQIIEKSDIMTIDIPEKVAEFRHPNQIEKTFDLEFKQEGLNSIKKFETLVEDVIKFSVKTTHARFYHNFYSRMDEVGLAGAWLLEALNTNVHTYEIAPLFVVMELHVIKEMCKIFEWLDGDGIFVPGGSMSNIFGISMGRHWKYPNINKEGLYAKKPMAILTSDMCHYSMEKGAAFMGIGQDNVYFVKSDANGRITADGLRQTIKQAREDGREPFFLNATSGTTVFGTFDPLDELAEVCQEEGIWMHVDACWGGAVMLSPNSKHLMKGIDRADSVAFNTHKMIGVPLQCTIFLVKHKGLLNSCHGLAAPYLFQPDKHYDVAYDTGDKTIQCGRKGDVLKLWLMLKYRGLKFYADRIDDAYAAAKYLESSLRQRPGFRLVLDNHDWTNICFWYIPESLRGQDESDALWKKKLHDVAPAIKKKISEAGTLMVAYQPIPSKDLPNFFRMVVTCFPVKTKAEMDFLLDEIEKYGKDL